ncbi:DUF3667 domain-containing protein [Acidiphilium iwatense]|uniref:DUF3667 domain-containing protein n=1 Tax=Acidiphilium iwatense TaxID=768198 RepID=A0ABS9DXD5_9PROT|nr:DUF3667 domain-containing protein [Acidiphilium iwatense]MCF3946361.1 DUF3667 domain-containing protein [Acidiphilium iwatense]
MDHVPHEMDAGVGALAGDACLNCGTARVGPWCHECGQHAEAVHRSVKRLAVEAVEAALETDGRFLRTVRRLAFDPAGLTRDYLAGKRVSQFGPFKLFVIALVLFLFFANTHVSVIFGVPKTRETAAMPGWLLRASAVLNAHGAQVLRELRHSAELFAFLTVPVGAAVLRLIFPLRRGVAFYDHLIFAMQSLAFQLVMLTLIVAMPEGWPDLLVLLPLAAMTIHLFVHMRGVYRTSKAGTVVRMLLLGTGTAIAYSALATVWLAAAALLALA